jgi:GNAT superfamily N-acetyltransferase
VPRIRSATVEDAVAIAELVQMKRLQYAAYQPTFWRVAPDAVERHLPYLQEILRRPNTIALVAEREDATLAGVVIASVLPSPPVYAPGGPTCAIDDYWVEDARDWATTGQALLAQALKQAKEAFGAAQAVVVCGRQDQPKRAMLEAGSYTVASEWWTKPL